MCLNPTIYACQEDVVQEPGRRGAGTRTTMHAKRIFKHAHCTHTHTPYTVKCTAESRRAAQTNWKWTGFCLPSPGSNYGRANDVVGHLHWNTDLTIDVQMTWWATFTEIWSNYRCANDLVGHLHSAWDWSQKSRKKWTQCLGLRSEEYSTSTGLIKWVIGLRHNTVLLNKRTGQCSKTLNQREKTIITCAECTQHKF